MDWDEAHGGLAEGVRHVELVAEADIEPDLNAACEEIVDYAVEPCPVVNALLLLALPPAGLDTGLLDANGGELSVAGFRIEEIAVEALEAD